MVVLGRPGRPGSPDLWPSTLLNLYSLLQEGAPFAFHVSSFPLISGQAQDVFLLPCLSQKSVALPSFWSGSPPESSLSAEPLYL